MDLNDVINESLRSLNVSPEEYFSSEFSTYSLNDLLVKSENNLLMSLPKVLLFDKSNGYLSVTVSNDNISLYYQRSSTDSVTTVIPPEKNNGSKSIMKMRVLVIQSVTTCINQDDPEGLYNIIKLSSGDSKVILNYIKSKNL